MTRNELTLLQRDQLRATDPGCAPDRDASLQRVRRGIYVDAAEIASADREQRILTRIRAVSAMRPRAVLARESALAVHGVPYGLEPDAVHTVGDARTARRKAGVAHAVADLDLADVVDVGGLRVTSLPYALAHVARVREPHVAVAAIDWALHRGLTTRDAIAAALARQPKRGRAAAAWAIAFADAGAESVGESWSRVLIHELGFEVPQLQLWVEGASGRMHRVDMRWMRPGRRPLYGEFDGMAKYGELAQQAGRSGARELEREKVREDDIRVSGDVARWVWTHLLHPERLERVLLAHGVPRIRPAKPGLVGR